MQQDPCIFRPHMKPKTIGLASLLLLSSVCARAEKLSVLCRNPAIKYAKSFYQNISEDPVSIEASIEKSFARDSGTVNLVVEKFTINVFDRFENHCEYKIKMMRWSDDPKNRCYFESAMNAGCG